MVVVEVAAAWGVLVVVALAFPSSFPPTYLTLMTS
jgi:hypothetical protein